MVDMADEEHPTIVARFMNEVADPANCDKVVNDGQVTTRNLDRGDASWAVLAPGVGFVYDDHYCTPDRLRNPTLLACAQIMSGLRVFDWTDPKHPKEIAYYNPGSLAPNDQTVDWALARPVIRRDLGQIWYVGTFTGFHALEFEGGLWPFPGDDPCPGPWDRHQAHYDPNYEPCLRASGGV